MAEPSPASDTAATRVPPARPVSGGAGPTPPTSVRPPTVRGDPPQQGEGRRCGCPSHESPYFTSHRCKSHDRRSHGHGTHRNRRWASARSPGSALAPTRARRAWSDRSGPGSPSWNSPGTTPGRWPRCATRWSCTNPPVAEPVESADGGDGQCDGGDAAGRVPPGFRSAPSCSVMVELCHEHHSAA